MKAGKIWGQTELIHANGVLEFHRIEYKAGFKCSEHEHQYKWNGFFVESGKMLVRVWHCLLYTSPSPRDGLLSRMPSSA